MLTPLETNTTKIQEILDAVNNLPEGGGTQLPTLSNPAGPENIEAGYEAIDGNGEKMTGTLQYISTLQDVYNRAVEKQIVLGSLEDYDEFNNIPINSFLILDAAEDYTLLPAPVILGGPVSRGSFIVGDTSLAIEPSFTNNTFNIQIYDFNPEEQPKLSYVLIEDLFKPYT